MKRITVTVPATSANLGPGFDCLGLALGLTNTFVFTETAVDGSVEPPGFTIAAEGVDAHKIHTGPRNLIVKAANIIFDHLGKRPSTHVHAQLTNQIPVGSGLGSSSTAVLAGMFAANALVDGDLSTADLLQFATDLEGHPDNVAPAVHGGLILGIMDTQLVIEPIPTPPLTVAVVLPDFALLTKEARAALPTAVSYADAIFNSSRLALLIRALETADYTKLAIAMQDRLHQPYRLPLIPGMDAAITAAKNAGAAAVALSGAGPSVIAFAPDNHSAIAAAIADAFAQHNLPSRQWVLPVVQQGLTLTQEALA